MENKFQGRPRNSEGYGKIWGKNVDFHGGKIDILNMCGSCGVQYFAENSKKNSIIFQLFFFWIFFFS